MDLMNRHRNAPNSAMRELFVLSPELRFGLFRGLIGILGLLPLTAIVGCDRDEKSAPYDNSGSGSGHYTGSLSEEPITTELHTYDTDYENSDRFRTYGPPLKITFPAKYYGYSTNFEGGPQGKVVLRLDGESLRSSADVIRERYGVRTADDVRNKSFGSGLGESFVEGPYKHEMSVNIYPRKFGTNAAAGKKELRLSSPDLFRQEFDEALAAGKFRHVGQLCGFDVYNRAEDGTDPPRFMPPTDSNHEPILSGKAFDGWNSDKKSSVVGIGCNDHPAICGVYIKYRGYGVTLNIDRNHVCEFWPVYNQLPNFLDQHASFPLPRG